MLQMSTSGHNSEAQITTDQSLDQWSSVCLSGVVSADELQQKKKF